MDDDKHNVAEPGERCHDCPPPAELSEMRERIHRIVGTTHNGVDLVARVDVLAALEDKHTGAETEPSTGGG